MNDANSFLVAGTNKSRLNQVLSPLALVLLVLDKKFPLPQGPEATSYFRIRRWVRGCHLWVLSRKRAHLIAPIRSTVGAETVISSIGRMAKSDEDDSARNGDSGAHRQ